MSPWPASAKFRVADDPSKRTFRSSDSLPSLFRNLRRTRERVQIFRTYLEIA
jgi:hypothetical protein